MRGSGHEAAPERRADREPAGAGAVRLHQALISAEAAARGPAPRASFAARTEHFHLRGSRREAFALAALAVSGQMLGADQLDVLAKLPTRDQALSMLMSVMKAPVTKLVQTMNEVPGKLVRTLAAVRDQKEAAA